MWATSQNDAPDLRAEMLQSGGVVSSGDNVKKRSPPATTAQHQQQVISPMMRQQLYSSGGDTQSQHRPSSTTLEDDNSAEDSSAEQDDITNEKLEQMVRAVWNEDDDDAVLAPPSRLGAGLGSSIFGQQPTNSSKHQLNGSGFHTPVESTLAIPPGRRVPPPVALFATPPTQLTTGLTPRQQQSQNLTVPLGDDENLGTIRRTPEAIQQLKAIRQQHLYSGAGSTLQSSAPPFHSALMEKATPPRPAAADTSFGSFTVTSHDDDDTLVSLKPGLRRGMGTPQQTVSPHTNHHRSFQHQPPLQHTGQSPPSIHNNSNHHTPHFMREAGAGGYQSSTGVTPAQMQGDATNVVGTIHDLAPSSIIHIRDISWRAQGPSNMSNKFSVFVQNLEPKTTKQDIMQIFFPFGGAEAEIQPFCPPGARRQGICYFSSKLLAVSGASKLNNFVPHGQTQPLLCAYDDEPWGEETIAAMNANNNYGGHRDVNNFNPGGNGMLSFKHMAPPSEATPGGLSSVATLHNTSANTIHSAGGHNSSGSELSVDQSIHSATMAALNPSPAGGRGGSTPGGGGGFSTRYSHHQHQQSHYSSHNNNNVGGVMMPGAAGTLGQGKALHHALQAAGIDPSTHWSSSSNSGGGGGGGGSEFRQPMNTDQTDVSNSLRLLLQKTPGIPQRSNLVNDIFDQFMAVSGKTTQISALTKVMLEHLKYHQQEGMRLLRHLIHKFNEPRYQRLRSHYLDPLSRPIVSVLLSSSDKPERIGVAIVVADLFECGFIGGTPFGMARKLTQAQVEGTTNRKDPDLIDALVSMTTAWASNHTDRKPTEDERVFCSLVNQHYKALETAALTQLASASQDSLVIDHDGQEDDDREYEEREEADGTTTPRGRPTTQGVSGSPIQYKTPSAAEQQHLSEEEARHLAAMTTPPPMGGTTTPVQVGTPLPGDGTQLSTPGSGGAHTKLDEDVVACTVYITRVPPGTAEAKLRSIFVECGDINKVRLYEDKQSRGAFGFVEFGSPVAATQMIRLNDRRHVDSSRMRCNAARNAIHDSDTRDAIIDHITGARVRDCLFGLSAKPQNTVVRTNRGFFAQ